MQSSKIPEFLKLIFAIFITQSAGFIGAIFTANSVTTWYTTIAKPVFNPPSWIFGPVWTLLYLMMGIALYLVYKEGVHKREVQIALLVFGLQLALNTLWSIIFFGAENPQFAFFEIIALWIAIFATIAVFWRISKLAAFLLIPYLLWVSFASVLNAAIWMLN